MIHTSQLYVFVLFLVFGMTALEKQSKTVAERLGFPAKAKLLIIHADDIGMSHSANTASFDALEKGIVTSGSVMVPCPWFLEVADYARNHPDVDIGLHLTHTSEWKDYRWRPLAVASLVPGLIDSQGYMHRNVGGVLGSANAEEIGAEIRAQIEFALKNGMKPTHLDSHMGTLYAKKEFFEVAVKLAEEYDIPFMLFHLTPEIRKRAGDSQLYPQSFVDMMDARGVPMLDALYSIHDTAVEESEAFYKNVIKNLKPGVSEIIIHLASPSPEIEAITNSHRQRIMDHRVFTDPEMREFIHDQGVHLIGWKDLHKLWKERRQ